MRRRKPIHAAAGGVLIACAPPCAAQIEREPVVVWERAGLPPWMPGEPSPDGRVVVTGGGEGELRFWDSATLALESMRAVQTDLTGVIDVHFAIDSPIAVLASSHGHIRRVQYPSLETINDFDVPGSVTGMDGSGRLIGVGGYTVYLWDGLTGKQLWSYQPSDGLAWYIMPSRDGSRIGVESWRGTLEMLTPQRELLWAKRSEDGTPLYLRDLSTDGSLVLASDSESVQILSGADGSVLRTFPDARGGGFSPDQSMIAFLELPEDYGDPMIVQVRRLSDDQVLAQVPTFPRVTSMSWSRDQRSLFMTGYTTSSLFEGSSDRWQMIDLIGQRVAAEIIGNIRGDSLDVSSDGITLLTTGRDGRANCWAMQSGRHLHANHTVEPIAQAQFVPGGEAFVISTGWTFAQAGIGEIKRFNARTGDVEWDTGRVGSGVDPMRISPDGSSLVAYIGDWSYGSASVRDAKTGRHLLWADRGEGAEFVTRDLFGARVYDQQGVVIHSTEDGSVVASWAGPELESRAILRRSPDGTVLVSAEESVLRAWRIPSGEPLLEAAIPNAKARSVNWAPDSRHVAITCDDDTLRVISAADGTEHVRVRLPVSLLDERYYYSVGDAAFTPDNTRIAVLRPDGRIWVILNPLLCRADCDGDGAATPADLACFQALWRARDPRADFDLNGLYNIRDFTAFQADWARQHAGECP